MVAHAYAAGHGVLGVSWNRSRERKELLLRIQGSAEAQERGLVCCVCIYAAL